MPSLIPLPAVSVPSLVAGPNGRCPPGAAAGPAGCIAPLRATVGRNRAETLFASRLSNELDLSPVVRELCR